MRINILIIAVCCCILLQNADAKRVRARPRPAPVESSETSEELPESESAEEDNRPQPAIQYYNAQARDNAQLIASDDEYNGYYGQPTVPTVRQRADYNRPSPTRATLAPRTKENSAKAPPVQTIRNYSKVNDDGSFTFGYEAADGSFKEETRGTDCVVRGKYGYIDPDGNKREFTYVSGNPCDPNNPDGQESDEERNSSDEDKEPENVPQNYPTRPIRPVRPIHTTTHAPTTVFQNNFAQHSVQQSQSEEEEPEPIQILQPQRSRPQSVQPLVQQYHNPTEISIRERPRITVSTTPSPVTHYRNNQVSITPRTTYRPTPQPPATTYRPSVQLKPQQPAAIGYSKTSPTARPIGFSSSTPNSIATASRRPVDFNAEFQKFQKEHNVPQTTTTTRTTTSPYKQLQIPGGGLPETSNPIYESQLVFDPSSGQYDSAIYQQLPQTDGEFQLNHRIQPYVNQPQLFSLDQLQHVNQIYRREPAPLPQFSQPQIQQPQYPQQQFSQQVYEKERENLQVLNSQQLFQQQQQLQNQQLQQDRIEAAKKVSQKQQQHQQQQQHRFRPSQQISEENPQGFYYIQPQGIQHQSSGQIDAFLRGHNLSY